MLPPLAFVIAPCCTLWVVALLPTATGFFVGAPAVIIAVRQVRRDLSPKALFRRDGLAMAEVVVVGSCNTDLVTYTPRLPHEGASLRHVSDQDYCTVIPNLVKYGNIQFYYFVLYTRIIARCAL